MTFVQNASFGHESLSNYTEMVSKGHDSCQTTFKPGRRREARMVSNCIKEWHQKDSDSGQNTDKKNDIRKRQKLCQTTCKTKKKTNLYMKKGHEDDW